VRAKLNKSIPSRSFSASRIRYIIRKKTSIVLKAIASSIDQKRQELAPVTASAPAPKDERPNALLKIWSMCASAAVVEGDVSPDADSNAIAVAVEGIGSGMCVAISM
jgi:hypothetical protein